MDQRKADWLAKKQASGEKPIVPSEGFKASVEKYRAWKAANPELHRQIMEDGRQSRKNLGE